ncbi:AraC family transcriptional regulator [Halopseudomonas oceani]|uniref:AraC family transcriptional regulator n=1 Tax=Halopseudomonas oceani TaxID=1708783 RepID=A0A2P4EYD0_9GAMM|nr:helix-turn-helix transcriptional regulator [Halopseudomonas oceani]POB05238.1 AraC family transcriptional regulator [Halopseudomonas oceani]GGE34292.1 AraC family transcriptional regulator [Halopseudomonas oceani]
MAYITFSTADYPLAERLEASQDIYAAMANIDVSLPRGKAPEIETRIRLLPGISIALIRTSPLTVKRRSQQIQDGNDDFALLLNPTGRTAWRSELAGVGEVECGPGAGCFGFNDRPGTIEFQGSQTYMLNICFSRSLLGPLIGDIERTSKSPRLAPETFTHLTQCAIELVQAPGPEDLNILADTNRLLDLAALSVGAPRDIEITARHRGLKQARLRAVKADLRISAWHGDTSLSWLAKRHGVSPGYIRAMFEQEGQSFTDYVLGLRLERVFQCLSSAAHAHKKVADIVYDAGFNNPSWFYRAFRRRFGLTPGEVRELASTQQPAGEPV